MDDPLKGKEVQKAIELILLTLNENDVDRDAGILASFIIFAEAVAKSGVPFEEFELIVQKMMKTIEGDWPVG